MMWFILGAIGLGVLCALGSPRRTVVNNYYDNDGGDRDCDYGGGGGYCEGDRDE